MKLLELLDHYARQLTEEKSTVLARGLDAPIEATSTRRVARSGTLHLYALGIPDAATVLEDVPLTILPPGDLDPTEGHCLQRQGGELLIQTLDSLGQSTTANTIIPDTSGFFETASQRLAEMAAKSDYYALGPAERLLSWIDPDQAAGDGGARAGVSATVLTTVWNEDKVARWTKLGTLVVECMRQNKRVLLLCPNHQTIDELAGFLAKALRAAALPFKSLLSCYEVPTLQEASGFPLQDFGFEAQMNGFFAKSRANKATLRKLYDRFRELTPILAYKGQKQKDLNEVKLLEWRLMAEVSDLQGKIKDVDKTVGEYESLPVWKRLAMQAGGKNVASLGEYRVLYEEKIKDLMKEVEIAQACIRELVPEAAIPKDMRPEYEELKEDITRLGGTKKIREMLAASEATNRQAFMQNKRLVAATPGRVVTDPLFKRVRFDVLIAEDAPKIPAPFLLGAAGLIRERIIISGDTQDLTPSGTSRAHAGGLWRQHCLEISSSEIPHTTPA